METKIIESETALGLTTQIEKESKFGWEPQGDILTVKGIEKIYNADASLRGAVPREFLAIKLVRDEFASRYWSNDLKIVLNAAPINKRAQRKRLRELSQEMIVTAPRQSDWR